MTFRPVSSRSCRDFLLAACIISFYSASISAFAPVGRLHSNGISKATPDFQRSFSPTKRFEKTEDEIEAEELQEKLNKLTEEPPMFAAWDAEAFDESALPVPKFTAIIIAVGSIVGTYHLYDVGLKNL
jgi:hypothetical protein